MNMYVEQLYTGCLAEAAYYIESKGEAVIIDPIRETEPYLQLAAERGTKIKYIFETHFHADFVSGHIDLAAKTGATIVYGPNANPQYETHIATDGEVFRVGDISITALHTPGHTLESTCYLLKDENGKDHSIFTGDTLFVGAVGRPDLAVKSERPLKPEDLASMMYDSLRDKIMPLADEVIVYPAHGPGSSCGKGIGPETWSTIGEQKISNYALQPMNRVEFVKKVTDGLGVPPAYFFEDARINISGYDSLDAVLMRNLRPLNAADVEAHIAEGALVLDTRIPAEFEAGHVSGAMNIGLNGSFATWVGTLIPIARTIVVVAEPGKEEEAVTRLARVGFENVAGFLQGGYAAWESAGKPTAIVAGAEAATIAQAMQAADTVVLDVRKCSEYDDGHVARAVNIPLSQLEAKLDTLDKDRTYLVHCRSGYRSMVGASILQGHGFRNIVNVYGGYLALEKTDIPLEVPVTA